MGSTKGAPPPAWAVDRPVPRGSDVEGRTPAALKVTRLDGGWAGGRCSDWVEDAPLRPLDAGDRVLPMAEPMRVPAGPYAGVTGAP